MSSWFPVLVMLLPMLVFVGIIYLWLRWHSGKRRNPLTRDLLRSPGQSLRDELEELVWNIPQYLFWITVIPLMLYVIYLSAWIEKRQAPGIFMVLILGALFFGAVGFISWKVVRLLTHRRHLQLGYDAELATGEELNQLGRDGFWIFHDVPAEKFNIDHVVVGPTGIFAVETKGRSKPTDEGTERGWEVTYDGKRLQFPGWSETKPLEQATRQAKWFRQWLASAVGESVNVYPVLVLPGWYVRRASGEGVMVINAREANTAIAKRRGAELPAKLIQQVVHQLDQRCRNVEPKAYRPLQSANQ
jgi:hypothetical protein